MERGYNILTNGRPCFGEVISAEAAIFQARLHVRDNDELLFDSNGLRIVDESGNAYDTFDAVEFGRLNRV